MISPPRPSPLSRNLLIHPPPMGVDIIYGWRLEEDTVTTTWTDLDKVGTEMATRLGGACLSTAKFGYGRANRSIFGL